MYKLLVVDNEPLIMDSIEHIVNRSFDRISQIKKAMSGRGAIESADDYDPDIIFIDILMPGINGLEAIREIKKKHPKVKFVVISAYDNFSYAKEALEMGAVEYILKPVDKTGIEQALRKTIGIIDNERSEAAKMLEYKEQIITILPIIENQLIHSLLYSDEYSEEISYWEKILDVKTDQGVVLSVEFAPDEGAARQAGRNIRIYENARNIIKAKRNCIVGNLFINRFNIVVTKEKDEMPGEAFEGEVLNFAADMVKSLIKNHQVKIGIGSIYSQRCFALNSYDHSLTALAQTQNGRYIKYTDICQKEAINDTYPFKFEAILMEALVTGDKVKTLEYFDLIFSWFSKTFNNSPEKIKIGLLPLAASLYSKNVEGEDPNTSIEGSIRFIAGFLNKANINEIYSYMKNMINIICIDILKSNDEQKDNIMNEVIKYLEQNYTKSITLEDVAKRVNFSPSYFSSLFHKKTSKCLIAYLTEIRMKKAKELITSTNYTLKEIALSVGYSNPNYFSRLFKKIFGLPPSSFGAKEEA